MEKLDLSGNNFGDEGTAYLSKFSHKIRRLHIRDCNITSDGIKLLSEAITKMKEPVGFMTYH